MAAQDRKGEENTTKTETGNETDVESGEMEIMSDSVSDDLLEKDDVAPHMQLEKKLEIWTKMKLQICTKTMLQICKRTISLKH